MIPPTVPDDSLNCRFPATYFIYAEIQLPIRQLVNDVLRRHEINGACPLRLHLWMLTGHRHKEPGTARIATRHTATISMLNLADKTHAFQSEIGYTHSRIISSFDPISTVPTRYGLNASIRNVRTYCQGIITSSFSYHATDLFSRSWSGREDLNLRPPGPELGGAELILLIFNH